MPPTLVRFKSAGQNRQHRRPGGDVLPEVAEVDLAERVVGRVVKIGSASGIASAAAGIGLAPSAQVWTPVCGLR